MRLEDCKKIIGKIRMRIFNIKGIGERELGIFAGSYDQARFLAHKLGLAFKDWKYVYDVRNLFGYDSFHVLIYGTYYISREASKILGLLEEDPRLTFDYAYDDESNIKALKQRLFGDFYVKQP